MKKRHTWIIVAIIALPVLVGIVLSAFNSSRNTTSSISLPGEKKLGVVKINGIIYDSKEYVRQLRELRRDKSVAAVILQINSGGGAVAPSQEIYTEVCNFRETGKPLVVSMNSVAASGGYYIAAGARTIFANPGTITGSFGVIMQFPHVYDLSRKIGIDFTTIKSGEYKDIGNPHRPIREEEKELLNELVSNTHEQFIHAIATGRGIDVDSVHSLADGRIFTGEQARSLGLVDTLGSFREAVSYCKQIAGLDEDAKLVSKKKPAHFVTDLLQNKLMLHFPLVKKIVMPPGLYFLYHIS